MAKFFKRLSAPKVVCSIHMTFRYLHASVTQPRIMQLKFIRGPQTDETKKFEVIPGQPDIDISETFTRDSSFYRDKDGF